MRGLVKPDVKLRIRGAETVYCGNGAGAFMPHQIGQGPAPQFLIAADTMSHARQLTHQAAQKMRVAVVPVRDQRMREQRNVEPRSHATAVPSPQSRVPGGPGFGSLGWETGVPGGPGFGSLAWETRGSGKPDFGLLGRQSGQYRRSVAAPLAGAKA